MDALSKEERDKIAHALEKKGAVAPCPRCKKQEFTVLDGYFAHPMQGRLSQLTLGGKSLPTAVIVCTHCGWLSEHALGVLELLPKVIPQKTDGE